MHYQQHVAAKEDAKRNDANQSGSASYRPAALIAGAQASLKITGVELYGAGRRAKAIFFTGDEMRIRLHYRAAHRIEKPVFGLAIHHQNGINIFGPNTKFGGLEIPYVDGDGVVVYTIPELPLLEGGYAISVAAVNDIRHRNVRLPRPRLHLPGLYRRPDCRVRHGHAGRKLAVASKRRT